MTENILFRFKLDKKDSSQLMFGSVYGRIMKYIHIVMYLLAVPFAVLAVVKEPGFIIFSILFILLGLLFGPYVNWMKKYHEVVYYDNDTLLLKSVINYIPNNFTVNLKEIAVIERENPLIAQALLFKDYHGRKKGRYNSLLIMNAEFNMLFELIRTRNAHIQIKL